MSSTARKFTRQPERVIYPDGPLTRTLRQDIARRVRCGHSFTRGDLDSQYLSDWADGKYPMKGFDRLVGLHISAHTIDAAYALPDSLALHIAQSRLQGALSFREASHAETVAVAAADPVQHEALSRGCSRAKRILVELLIVQRRATDQLIHAALADLRSNER